MKSALWALALAVASAWAAVATNPEIGYSITLPDHWGQVTGKPLQDYFRDSTRTHHSQISILRYAIDKASYPTPESWSQAQFIAYKLSVETSAFPYGAVMYYDSSSAAKIGTVWSPEAYSVLWPADGTPTYSEYIRYCAVGEFGYEIYAIGDSTDMINNVDYYAGVISTLQFTSPAVGLVRREAPGRRPGTPAEHWFDAMGRVRASTLSADPRGPFFAGSRRPD